MNEKIKKAFAVVASFFVGISSAVIGFLLSSRRNRPSSNSVGEQLERIGEIESGERETLERERTIVTREREINQSDSERIEDSRRIIEEIRNKKQQ